MHDFPHSLARIGKSISIRPAGACAMAKHRKSWAMPNRMAADRKSPLTFAPPFGICVWRKQLAHGTPTHHTPLAPVHFRVCMSALLRACSRACSGLRHIIRSYARGRASCT